MLASVILSDLQSVWMDCGLCHVSPQTATDPVQVYNNSDGPASGIDSHPIYHLEPSQPDDPYPLQVQWLVKPPPIP